MRKKYIFVIPILISLGLCAVGFYLLRGHNFGIMDPKGPIAAQQKNLIIFTIILSLIVVIPVFALTIFIALKYRATNKKATYTPTWDGNRRLELTWWAIPMAIIFVLAVVTWRTSHSLDPYKPIASDVRPVRVQVVALQWKWLFIYPEQRVASLNYLAIPEDTPIEFEITADAPMNSFWIPQLGGQIYAMPGMQTKLHLLANEPGTYRGSSANLSGEGFAGMHFDTVSMTRSGFDQWTHSLKQLPDQLTWDMYTEQAKPSKDAPVHYFSQTDSDLFDRIIHTYMSSHDMPANDTMEPMHHEH